MLHRLDSSRLVFTARRLAVAMLLTLVVAACGNKEAPYVERPVEDLYNNAMNAMAAQEWEAAAKGFDEVERQHPYSVWANKAQLMAAYSYYQKNMYSEAISAADRFIQLHPGSKETPYAYYLTAVCYYEQITDVGRDQKITQQALGALEEVVRRYPNSEYARDARLKIDLTRDHLAGKEMTIGRYYLRNNQQIAAINRFKTVIEKFQTTTHVPEALHRLAEAYMSLGILDEAQNVAAVLGYNYPGSEWYVDTYTLVTGQEVPTASSEKKSWWNIF
ncbi:MAG: outer membrane protein assembly factor BamD [Ferrovibrio sp.]|uniref:outer membrane protein assembly factor BamD n=1 Tax=Ferrovibrio sp. TaxID=1917215 RepID=UPI00260628D7|nr:outer membrane protein assembly factor BamD [Ferrovibrio sp.]MCW0232729.1 outer membrane protein assembly factor BamD [Ferrovibrio sp.]